MKIAMATPYYLPHIGGVEQHVAEVARRLAAEPGVSVTVLTTGRELGLPEHETLDGVEIRRFAGHPRGRDWLLAPGLARAIRSGAWDVVHLQSYHTLVAPLAMRAAGRAGLPYVVTFHGGGHSSPLRTKVRRLQRRALGPLLRRAARLVAVAQFEITTYGRELGVGPERFVLIPNGVDLPADDGSGAPEATGGPLIASVGRLERYKGHQRLLAALPHVLRSEPDARVWIAGSGPYEAALRQQAARLDISDRVEISAVPMTERQAMARRLRSVDLVVLLSDFETHPVAAMEALGLGRPLLVGTGSGLGELADRGLARSVDPASAPDVVAHAIVRELREPLTPAVSDLPTWDACAAELLDLYREIASDPR